MTATLTKDGRHFVSKQLGLCNEAVIAMSPCKPNIKYCKLAFDSIEKSFSSIAKDLGKKRTCYPRSIIYCRRCEDCSDIFLYFQDGLGACFTEPPNASFKVPGFRLVDMFMSCTEEYICQGRNY